MRGPGHDLVRDIKEETARVLASLVCLRQTLHAAPEIGTDLPRTRDIVAESLTGLGLSLRDPMLSTDLVADLDVGAQHTVCLRADMDALPIQEETDLPYRSTRDNCMHACGHDGHTAALVGAATVLAGIRDRIPCNVRFIFQPGEEVLGHGKELVARGVCDGAFAAYAFHGWPGLPVGVIGSRPGTIAAAGAFFTCEFTGRGCHGALPETGANPIPVAGLAAERLKSVHDELNRETGDVVSVCSFSAGEGFNVIPDKAVLAGTFRYLEETRGGEIERRIAEAVRGATEGTGVSAVVDVDRRYDMPVVNDEECFKTLRGYAEDALPAGSFFEIPKPSMVTEDFAFYLK
ncbi:MAG: amidohydrolase, partial [Lentisphaerae bacterium]|nr:amidohydrolase [Lentisphaerota bacterium]